MHAPIESEDSGARLPIGFKRATRFPRPGWGPLVALLAVIMLLGSYEIVQSLLPEPDPGEIRTSCTFRKLSGVPCPGCGSTRAVKAAARLAPMEALRHNPLVMIGLGALGLALLFRAISGYTLRVDLGAAGWTAVGVVVLVLFVLNWWWVLRQHGFLLGTE